MSKSNMRRNSLFKSDCPGIVCSTVDMIRSPHLASDLSDLPPEELVRACTDLRDAAAWNELVRRFNTLIVAVVWRTGRRYAQFDRGLCDDLVQDTYLRLSANGARALRLFVPRHPESVPGYFAVIAARVTHDYCRSKKLRHLQELPADLPDSAAPDKAQWLAHKAAIGQLLIRHSSARDRQIFGLHFLQGMTAKEIAAIPAVGLSLKGVESVIVRLRRLIQENLGPGKRD